MVFLGDIAFIFDMFLFSSGLIVLHWANKEASKLLKFAAWVMIIIGVLAVICTTYYWMSYYLDGAFNMSHMMSHSKS